MRNYAYGESFFDYSNRISLSSARAIVQIVRSVLNVKSVLDVGCSRGNWLRQWQEAGIIDYVGLDGGYIDPATLLISQDHFQARNLELSFDLGRLFDLVQCLEVAEHLTYRRSDSLVGDLVKHGSIVLFSAAPPGQGGEHHVNERPYEFWRDLFVKRDFTLVDYLRGVIAPRWDIAPWYRYNTFLYVHASQMPMLPKFVQICKIEPHSPIPDRSPVWYRIRKFIVRSVPFEVRQAVSRITARLSKFR